MPTAIYFLMLTDALTGICGRSSRTDCSITFHSAMVFDFTAVGGISPTCMPMLGTLDVLDKQV